jgi:predicted small metal-binding protein
MSIHERKRLMKTMTCKQLGGSCDFPLHGDTADEVIKVQDKHLKEMVAGGDETHNSALKEMKGRWRHPLSGMAWYKKTKRDFAALPDD